ncbi:PiggyBac transposable element-derived protein [Cinara cedri]|uniref:PiggyBac transposable element-derived protein n=1 Tax=Cinara cedri TaxID=506608 RepID=A0A5E4M4I5_9HEMI|nr:PiggyBac transposable element-derived protein [Cinara cedri]
MCRRYLFDREIVQLLENEPPSDSEDDLESGDRSPNLGNQIIQETMSVNQFEQIRQFIHFNNNNNMLVKGHVGHDRLHKIRPVTETLKKRFASIPLEEALSIDEQLCSTKAPAFKEDSAISLCKVGQLTSTRGRPSNIIKNALIQKFKKRNASKPPNQDLRMDRIDHWPIDALTRSRFKIPGCNGYTWQACKKYQVRLCVGKGKTYFKKYHTT